MAKINWETNGTSVTPGCCDGSWLSPPKDGHISTFPINCLGNQFQPWLVHAVYHPVCLVNNLRFQSKNAQLFHKSESKVENIQQKGWKFLIEQLTDSQEIADAANWSRHSCWYDPPACLGLPQQYQPNCKTAHLWKTKSVSYIHITLTSFSTFYRSFFPSASRLYNSSPLGSCKKLNDTFYFYT